MIVRLVLCFQFISFFCYGQVMRKTSEFDSICKFGKKYDEPQRKIILFPSINVSNEYKIEEIHVGVPETFNNDTSSNWWTYHYFYEAEIYDYNPPKDSTFIAKKNLLLYKLKDTFFMDLNGDKKLDYIHYPQFYKAIMLGWDSYDVFIKQENDYKIISIQGFITDIKFHDDGTLNTLETYQGSCCGANFCTFYKYKFDKNENELILIEKNEILLCQLTNWPHNIEK